MHEWLDICSLAPLGLNPGSSPSCVTFCVWLNWHPTPVLLPGKSHGQRSLVGRSPWGREESDTTEQLPFLSLFIFTHWRRKWQPTPVFLPGVSQGRGSLVGFHLWGRTDTTEATLQQQQQTSLSQFHHLWRI